MAKKRVEEAGANMDEMFGGNDTMQGMTLDVAPQDMPQMRVNPNPVYQKEQVRRKDFDTRKEYKDAKNLENQKADNYFISDKEYESLIKNAQKVFELKMNALGMDSVWELYATDDFDEINEQEVGRADNTILISKTDSKFKQWVKSFVGSKKMQLIAGCSRLVSNFDNRFKYFANMYGLKSSSDIDTFDNVINSTYGETEAQQYIDNYVDPEGRRRR